MKLALTGALALCITGVTAFAQMQDNTQKQLTCDNGNNGDSRARHCDIREIPTAAVGRLSVDSSPNGGISVKGWLRNDVLVRARVETSADTPSAAAAMAGQVMLDASGGQVRATGPQSNNDSWWSVSYEIFVPQTTDLTLKTVNGGMTISDVRGQIRFDVVNGGVRLKRVAGDVSGASVNGGLQVELAGNMWDGRQLDVKTQNGGVTLSVPARYSAHIQAETHMGRVQSDFPVTMTGELMPRRLEFNVGGGGAPIHIATTNGGVHIRRLD